MLTHHDLPVAFALARGMARTVGVDLIGAVTEGFMTRRDLDALVSSCQACPAGDTCTLWLAGTVSAGQLPGFCANKPVIEGLRG